MATLTVDSLSPTLLLRSGRWRRLRSRHSPPSGLARERVGNTQIDRNGQPEVDGGFPMGGAGHLTKLKEYCTNVSLIHWRPTRNLPGKWKDAFRTGMGVHAAAVIKAFLKGDIELANSV